MVVKLDDSLILLCLHYTVLQYGGVYKYTQCMFYCGIKINPNTFMHNNSSQLIQVSGPVLHTKIFNGDRYKSNIFI